jgi:hypothetical protein
MAAMAGVFAKLSLQRRPGTERQVFASMRLNRKAQELQTAKEILQEVFGTTSAEVEEMIRLRLAERDMLGSM